MLWFVFSNYEISPTIFITQAYILSSSRALKPCDIYNNFHIKHFQFTYFVLSFQTMRYIPSFLHQNFHFTCLCVDIYIYMGRWFFGCPAYQSGPGKDGFRIDVSMASQSSFSSHPETVLPRTGLIRGAPEKPSAHI